MCQTQKLNYIAGVNFDACTNYSTQNVFPGKDWLSGEYCHFDKKNTALKTDKFHWQMIPQTWGINFSCTKWVFSGSLWTGSFPFLLFGAMA